MRTRRRPSHFEQLPFNFASPPSCLSSPSPALPQRGPDPLAAALTRHARIEATVQTEGANPYPDEIEEEWSCQLAAFHFVGPLEATLLQNAGRLADLTEEELHPDLVATLSADRHDVAALITAELRRWERE